MGGYSAAISSQARSCLLYTSYWEEELEVIAWGQFDTLAHLTYPLRYIQGEHGIPVDLAKHQEAIDQIFRALIDAGKALEVNTSGSVSYTHLCPGGRGRERPAKDL